MPCDSSHMEPTKREQESQRVATLIIYVHSCLMSDLHPNDAWVIEASRTMYGNPQSADELTAKLCELCDGLTDTQKEVVIYNAKDKNSRALADWWEDHQKADRWRIAQEARVAEAVRHKNSGLKKLTREEKVALGLTAGEGA